MELYNKSIKILSLIAVAATVFFAVFVFYMELINTLPRHNHLQTLQLQNNITNFTNLTNNKNYNNTANYGLSNLPDNSDKPLKLLFFGDMMLDRHVGEKINKYGLDYIFDKFASSTEDDFFNSYDVVSCNLEGAVTNNSAYYAPVMSYDFAFAPELINELKKYNFNFFNLANNHLADQGERGIIETRENLEKLGFNYSGCRDGKVGECSSTVVKITDKRVGIVGFSMVYSKLNMAEVEKVVSNFASTTDLVIINMHWGKEYEHQFNKAQQRVAYSLIDAGADIIIGHHPHVVQGIEVYQSKLIFYSLGNFVFDQYFSADTQEGLAVGISVNDQQIEIFLYPIKSKLSQVELMYDKEKDDFLQRLVEWSDVEEEVVQQIKESKL